MSRISKLKINFTAIILATALIAIPNTNFNATVSAEDVTVTEEDTIVSFSTDLEYHINSMTDESETLLRARTIDLAKAEAEKELAQQATEPTEPVTEAVTEAATEPVTEIATEPATEPPATSSVNYDAQYSSGYLLAIDNVNPSYTSYSINLSDYDRSVLEHLVMGEAGGEGFIGAALVAQAIRDTMVYDGYSSVESVRVNCGYYASLDNSPNSDVLEAISFIFDQGGAAVQHELRYFYAYQWCSSSWHETQEFVVTYGGHKFFDRW